MSTDNRPDVDIRERTDEPVRDIARLVGTAFADETFTRLALGKRAASQDNLTRLFELQLTDHLSRGGLIDLAYLEGELVGAALWERPDGDRGSLKSVLSQAVDYLRLVRWRALRSFVGQLKTDFARPNRKHWYMHLLAADPSTQGKGVGSSLLRHGLQRLKGGEPAYLESSNDGTTRLYEKFDFLTAGRIRLWPGYEIGRMWRPASASQR